MIFYSPGSFAIIVLIMKPSLVTHAGTFIILSRSVYAAIPFHTISYGTSANGFSTAIRGWNSFGLQEGSPKLQQDAGWDFNDYHFRQHCSKIVVEPGFDYVCSIDSGWSTGCNGDINGVPEPDANIIPDIVDLGKFLHNKGLKLGVYVLPGAFDSDGTAGKVVEGTDIKIQSLFDPNQPGYNCRRAFDYRKDGTQQWHESVIKRFASWYATIIYCEYVLGLH